VAADRDPTGWYLPSVLLSFHVRQVAWGALIALLGCNVPRPQEAYRRDASVDQDEDDQGDDDGFEDDTDTPPDRDPGPEAGRDAGRDAGKDAGAVGVEPDAGPIDETPVPDGSALLGDYWMRSESHTEASAELGLVSLATETDTTLYALVRVARDGQRLTFQDQQCAISLAQRCTRGCSSVSTTMADPVKSARAFAAPKRTLTVGSDGRWSASRVPFAVGWRGDFNADPTLALPTSEDDPLVYDPDGGRGAGIDLTSTVRLSAGFPLTCNVRLVQKFDLSYAGRLAGEALESGTSTDMGSSQRVLNTLSATCGGMAEIAEETAPSTLRFVRGEIAGADGSWTCPTLSTFEAAFR